MNFYESKERRLVAILLGLMSLKLAYGVRIGWKALLDGYAVNPPKPGVAYNSLFTIPPVLHAPEAYRVAIPAMGRLIWRLIPKLGQSGVAGLLDFIFFFAASMLFYVIVREQFKPEERVTIPRVASVMSYIALLPFALAWVVAFQRPETMPTSLYLAATVFCLARSRGHWGWSVALATASIWQGFVRADIAIVSGVALMLLSGIGIHLESFGSRLANFLRGAAMCVGAGTVQFYLQFVRFREAKYWAGYPIVCFSYNLHEHRWLYALGAALPFLVIFIVFFRRDVMLKPANLLILVSSFLYLPLWFGVGHAEEVRIFVPFLIAWSAVAGQLVGESLGRVRSILAS